MKKILLYFAGIMLAMSAVSCLGSNDVEDKYKDWREANDEWFAQQKANTDYYMSYTLPWDNNRQVLIHWFNDTMLTRDNLRPLYTSTVDLKYRGMDKDGLAFDSSYLSKNPADSLVRFDLSSTSYIEGWAAAITRMHVGDSCRVVIPYTLGYGSSQVNELQPYTHLVFDIKLVDIYHYETN